MPRREHEQGRKFRKLREKPYIFTPGVTTPLHAMIVEKAGFDYVYVGGYDVSLTLLGLPDVGLITETEMVSMPATRRGSVDASGDGRRRYRLRQRHQRHPRGARISRRPASPASTSRIRSAPSAAVTSPARRSLLADEAVGKIRAALDARRDKDFVIMARTDAVAAQGGGLDEAVRRGKAFARAGADMVWSEFPNTDMELAAALCRRRPCGISRLPLYFNFSSNLEWHKVNVTVSRISPRSATRRCTPRSPACARR